MKPYHKRVNKLELDITQIASVYAIAPTLTSTSLNLSTSKGSFDMVMYQPLIDLPRKEWIQYKDQLIEKLEKLHLLGILWLDPSEENIVVDGDEAYLIDFGMSRFTGDLKFDGVTVEEAFMISKQHILFLVGLRGPPVDLAVYDGTLVIEE